MSSPDYTPTPKRLTASDFDSASGCHAVLTTLKASPNNEDKEWIVATY